MHWSAFGPMAQQVAKNPNLTQVQFASNPQLQEDTMDHYIKTEMQPQIGTLRKTFPNQTTGLSDDQIGAMIHHRGYPNAKSILGGYAAKDDRSDAVNYLRKMQ